MELSSPAACMAWSPSAPVAVRLPAEENLPPADEARTALLEGYAAATLGLVPEAASRKSGSKRATVGGAVDASESSARFLETEGSSLPLRQDWLYLGVGCRSPKA